jgi:hypothetical protein
VLVVVVTSLAAAAVGLEMGDTVAAALPRAEAASCEARNN